MKKSPASSTLIRRVERLFKRATTPPRATIAPVFEEKLFELHALGKLLALYKAKNPSAAITLEGRSKSIVTVAQGVASADKAKYSYFKIADGRKELEAWVSVQIKTLSWELAGKPHPLPHAAKHEVDVAIFNGPVTERYPSYESVVVGVSCKHVGRASKHMVREILGIRRETALLSVNRLSRAPWLIAKVPAKPASPIFLLSSDAACRKYRDPLQRMGVYIRYSRFPF